MVTNVMTIEAVADSGGCGGSLDVFVIRHVWTGIPRTNGVAVLNLRHRLKFPTQVQGLNAFTVRNSTQNTW